MAANQIYSHQFMGDLASQKAIEYKTFLNDLINNGNVNLSLDLTNTHDVDVVGVNAIAMTYKHIRGVNGSLEIILKKESQLAKMLHLTKFEKMLTLKYL
jgi:anti-anti-sigma regulatory factor